MPNSAPNNTRVYMLPWEDRHNLYFELLKQGLSAQNGVSLLPFSGWGPIFFGKKAGGTKTVLHIHWSTVLYGSKFLLKSVFLMTSNFGLIFFAKKFRGLKVVWTIHNNFAHEYPHPWLDRVGRRLLWAAADGMIVQQQSTLLRLKETAEKAGKKITYIPHGNYVGTYGIAKHDSATQKEKYGFAENELVVLSFGAVRPYKKNIEIIENVKKTSVPLRLWIVGRATAAEAGRIVQAIGQNNRIKFENRFVSNSEIPDIFAAADYSVFYYDESEMTSGGMILSLSYGVPVITRNIPAAEIIKKGQNGFVFRSDQELQELLNLITLTSETKRREVLTTVSDITFQSGAQKTAALYAQL